MRVVVGVLIGVVFVVAVIIGAREQLRTRCEVCLEYRTNRTCETARAANRDLAIMQATTAACAKLSGGVTEGIRCNSTPPISTTCSD
jgi:hypothetical protein